MFETETKRRERKERMDRARAEAFDKWLAKPEIKALASCVPPCSPPETFQTLLRSAFDAGCATGEGNMACEMLEAILKTPKPGTT